LSTRSLEARSSSRVREIYVHLKRIQARLEDIGAMLSDRDLSVLRERRRVVRFLSTTVPGLARDCDKRMRAPEVCLVLERLGTLATCDPDDRDRGKEFEATRRELEELHSASGFN
jgi:hypothetical protein